MLKMATVAKDGKPLLVLGLTQGNIERLTAGDPISIDTDELKLITGVDLHIAIMYGETAEALVAELREAGLEMPPGVDAAIARARRGDKGFAGQRHQGDDR